VKIPSSLIREICIIRGVLFYAFGMIRRRFCFSSAAASDWRMIAAEVTMKTLTCLVFLFIAASVALAGEIYGTIDDAGKPVAGAKIEVSVAGKSFTGESDKVGAYHIFAAEKGKGTLTADYKGQKPTADIVSYEKATRYDWTVEVVEGKLTLKRK
jgi:hypothetical protein